eukprot:gnl/Chilomastix_caulleri/1298.p1 GENE.gnl/Chilomastix_caulleri/1298~~gnl/Chilomastix_caulleri/1298.p1  ORF type:complete len:150 (+),score=28.57 gnl/Chilomastix_caulleri/1298:30-452(+)
MESQIVIPRQFVLLSELELGEKGDTGNVSYGLTNYDDRTFTNWSGTIYGPTNTVFDTRIYNLRISCGVKYPSIPPKVSFLTRVSMGCVDEEGRVDLDKIPTLSPWQPSLRIIDILNGLFGQMKSPINQSRPQPPEGVEYK